jgi:hypothetical protein
LIDSPEEFLRLIDSADSDERRLAVTHHVPEALWNELLERYPERAEAVALNKNLPDDVLRTLAKNDDPRVRFHVAMKRRLPADLWQPLAVDADESVRHRVALNPKAPEEIVALLANDEATLVRQAALRRVGDVPA